MVIEAVGAGPLPPGADRVMPPGEKVAYITRMTSWVPGTRLTPPTGRCYEAAPAAALTGPIPLGPVRADSCRREPDRTRTVTMHGRLLQQYFDLMARAAKGWCRPAGPQARRCGPGWRSRIRAHAPYAESPRRTPTAWTAGSTGRRSRSAGSRPPWWPPGRHHLRPQPEVVGQEGQARQAGLRQPGVDRRGQRRTSTSRSRRSTRSSGRRSSSTPCRCSAVPRRTA